MRKIVAVLLMSVLMGAGGLVLGTGTATAAIGDIGFQDQSYKGATNVPTADKPQSKLWFAHGSWWANMFDTTSKTWHIFRLERTTQDWIDTGVRIDERVNSSADVLWDGTRLYVASHVVTTSGTAAAASVPGSPARLYRYSYSAASGYSLDAGFPVDINNNSSESMTLAKDSTGTLWATWTQVTATASGGFTNAVYVNSTSGGDATWAKPFVLPVSGSTVTPDDISSVVAFAKNKVGVIWSNQLDGSVYWAVHADGASRTSWKVSPAVRGSKQSDDHINIKAVQADTSGRVFAVVKTSLDAAANPVPSDPSIRLLSFKPSTGSWSATTVATVADCHTRPLLMLDEPRQTVHVFATAPTADGCAYSGAAGSIYAKAASMDRPVFAAGRGIPVIRDIASAHMNDVTGSKQSASAVSGIVVLASNKQTQRYWHADLASPLKTRVAPTASFTSATTSGQAPLPVQFTDTSTGSPTSWAWNFGDGSTATTQHPAHTYAAAGTYTVTLTATNSGGTSAPVSATVTVTAAPPVVRGTVTAGPSASAAATSAVVDVSVPLPAGLAAGDLLVAQVTADNSPAMSTVPAGWTSLFTSLRIGSGARLFAYYHVVTDPATEADPVWQLSAAQRWGAGITAFRGVDTADPFDTAASTVIDSTGAALRLTVPGVTTVTDGAMLVGGVGLNNVTAAVEPAQGWTEAWESAGGQISELVHRPAGAAAAGADAAWSFEKGVSAGGWLRALRAAPVPPSASFSSSVPGGRAPLPVQFTDTSTGSPTGWAWDFGDGATATTQHPAHTYTAAGTFTVRLTATNAGGTSRPVTGQITVAAAPVAPTASFTPSVTDGQAPLPVQFTDTSTGSPTGWAWDFGDGATATTQHPAHTYTAAGTYTVVLRATNAAGAGVPVTATVTITAPPAVVGERKVGATTEARATSSTRDVVVTRPAGVVYGDVLVVRLITEKASSVTTVPAGWTAAPGNTSRISTYYHVVTGVGAEPAGYTWRISSPSKWRAIMTGFSGVDPRTPLTAVGWAWTVWPRV